MDNEDGANGTRRSGRVKNKPKYTVEDGDEDDDVDTGDNRRGREESEEEEKDNEKVTKSKQKGGRRKKGSDDEEDAYELSESSASDVSEEYEEPSASEEDEDDEYGGDDEEEDEEEWDRRRRRFVQVGRYGRPYSSHAGHDLPPFLAEAVNLTAASRPMPFVQGGSTPAMLTKEQIQELAKNAVSSLASVNPITGRKLPVLLPKAPTEQAEQIKSTVSAELRESIASLLLDPSTRASMIRQMQGASAVNSMAPPNGSSSGGVMYPQHPIPGPRHPLSHPQSSQYHQQPPMPRPMTHLAPRKIVKTTRHNIDPDSLSASRPRRAAAAKKVDYSTYFKDDNDDGGDSASDNDDQPDDGNEEQRQGVEKILSYKKERTGRELLYVKYWGLSYLHCEWVERGELEADEKGMATRIKKFLAKPLTYHHHSADHIFNPDFVKLERIVYGWRHEDEEDPRKLATSYLIKWAGLPYEDATWEREDFVINDIPQGAEHVQEYKRRPNVDDKRFGALPVGRRPDPQAWKPFEESPRYKDDHLLRPYQLEGVNWLVFCWMNKQSCIIADEMGLGKTVQSVAFLELLYQHFKVRGPFLIVCPLSTLPHWQREFESWTDLNVIVYHGSKASRDVMYEYEFFFKNNQDQPIAGFTKFDVMITTYEMAMAGIDQLQNITWRAGVFDEAHRLKNRASKAADVLKGLEVEHKILLSGTPIQNSILELWSLLNFLQPQRFYSEEDFMDEYGDLATAEDVERLQDLLKPLMLRRLKEDVEKSIPVKEETIIEVELTPLQKRYYRAILEKNFAFLTQGCSASNAPNLLNAMMELRKCCIHPFLIKGAEERILDELGVDQQDRHAVHQAMIQASGKLVLVDKLLRKLREGGHKVLIFSQMTKCLDILADYLKYRQYPTERIDGAIKGADRQAAIDRFCDANTDSFVFLLCTRAGGVGINLTAADTVVIFDSDWNPQNDLQAQARCHRIGQTKAVKIYRLITRNTYERDMFDRAGMKLGLDRAVLQKMVGAPTAVGEDGQPLTTSASGGIGAQLSRKEVETLLKKGAYGVLMDTNDDDAANKFCDEDIEQILERRTTVIRHDDPTASASTDDGKSGDKRSIFSKATFTATNADDFDIDIDDPNFWELWAKKLEMNPRALLAASSAASGATGVDEPRVKRLVKRLRTANLAGSVDNMDGKTVVLTPRRSKTNKGNVVEWTVEEIQLLIRQLSIHGIGRFHDLPALFPDRTKNDIVAAAKAILKAALDALDATVSDNTDDHGDHGDDDDDDDNDNNNNSNNRNNNNGEHVDGKFKEDAEKAILWKLDFDKPNGKQKPEDLSGYAKHEIPYQGATRLQCDEYKTMCALLLGSDARLKITVRQAKLLLLRVQVMEMVKQIVERNASNLKAIPVPGTVAGAAMPNWWGRDADVDLIIGFYRHGYLSSELMRADAELLFSSMTFTANIDTNNDGVVYEWPSDEALDSRLRKLLLNMEKRAQVASKLAAHQLSVGEQRQRRRTSAVRADSPDHQKNGRLGDTKVDKMTTDGGKKGKRRRRGRRDDDESDSDADSDSDAYTTARRGKAKKPKQQRKTAADAIKEMREELLQRWSTKEKAEFHRVICLFGLPKVTDGTKVKQSPDDAESDSDSEESPFFTGPRRDWSLFRQYGDFGKDKTSARFNEYCHEYLHVIDLALQGERGKFPLDKAKKARHAIDLFARLRAFIRDMDGDSSGDSTTSGGNLGKARRSAGLPKWWQCDQHDRPFLRGVAQYGLADPARIITDVEPFTVILEQAKTDPAFASSATASASSRRSTRTVNSVRNSSSTTGTTTNSGDVAEMVGWPNESVCVRRVEYLLDLVDNKAPSSSASANMDDDHEDNEDNEEDEEDEEDDNNDKDKTGKTGKKATGKRFKSTK